MWTITLPDGNASGLERGDAVRSAFLRPSNTSAPMGELRNRRQPR
jgi:hypothetical protein